ncbi:MAG: hypothetical protein JXR37_10015 [Kiritimatiellae bacterium]|nr:hypothetical protein [Kiritimatiellia bacterium]
MLPGFDLANHWLVANNTFAFQKNRAGICVWPGYHGSCDDVEIVNNVLYKNSESPYAASNCGNGIEL